MKNKITITLTFLVALIIPAGSAFAWYGDTIQVQVVDPYGVNSNQNVVNGLNNINNSIQDDVNSNQNVVNGLNKISNSIQASTKAFKDTQIQQMTDMQNNRTQQLIGTLNPFCVEQRFAANEKKLRQQFNIDVLQEQKRQAETNKIDIPVDAATFIRDRETHVAQIDRDIAEYKKQMASADLSNPADKAMAEAHLDSLYTLRGRQNQTYMGYINDSIDQQQRTLEQVTHRLEVNMDAYEREAATEVINECANYRAQTTVSCPANSSYSNTDSKCHCSGGYQNNTENTACVVIPTKTNTQVSSNNSNSGTLTILDSTQPSNGPAIQGAARVPFTKITLTAGSSDVVVNGITVQRTGAAVDANFAGIVLLQDDGTQLDIAKTLGLTHQAIVGGTFTVKAGTSMNLTVAGNMAANLANMGGQVAALQVVAINTTAIVTGTLPLVGAYHTINGTLTIGTVTGSVSLYDPATIANKAIGTTGYKFSGVRLTAGSAEDVRLKSVRFYQAGSAGANDLSNVKIYVDGTAYDTTVSTDSKYYTANFGTGVVITKGLAKDIWIAGDITGSGSAGRTIDFDIQKNTDLYVTGEIYGQGIIAGGTITTATPALNGYAVTVTAGSMTSAAKANSVAAQNIAINLANQVPEATIAKHQVATVTEVSSTIEKKATDTKATTTLPYQKGVIQKAWEWATGWFHF